MTAQSKIYVAGQRGMVGSAILRTLRVLLDPGHTRFATRTHARMDLARTVAKVVGNQDRNIFDTSRPDGPPHKLIHSSRLHKLGWKPKAGLEEELALAYADFMRQSSSVMAA